MNGEIDYGALFGIDEGGNEQEAAEPAMDESSSAQGENEQEPAEPAGEEEKENSAGGDRPPEEGEAEADPEKAPAQTPEQNAAFAAARRKAEAERDAAIAKAREDAQAEARRVIDEAFRDSGLTDPYTQRPITSKAEYDAYRERFEAERKDRVLKKSGMSDEEFKSFVESLPEVRQAREAQREAEQAQREAQEARAKIRVDGQLKEIAELNPNIRELKDLAEMDTYPRFYELVKKGNTLVDAYKLANYDALRSAAAEGSRQAAINAVQGKSHLAQTASRGAGAAAVPADVKEAYRAFNPDATDAEIQRHYNSYVKRN